MALQIIYTGVRFKRGITRAWYKRKKKILQIQSREQKWAGDVSIGATQLSKLSLTPSQTVKRKKKECKGISWRVEIEYWCSVHDYVYKKKKRRSKELLESEFMIIAVFYYFDYSALHKFFFVCGGVPDGFQQLWRMFPQYVEVRGTFQWSDWKHWIIRCKKKKKWV